LIILTLLVESASIIMGKLIPWVEKRIFS